MLVTDTRRGGTPLRMAAAVEALADRGWEVLTVSVMPAGPVLDELAAAGLATASLELTSIAGGARALRRLRRLLTSFRPDVAHAALWHANLLARLAAVGTGIAVVNGHESVDDVKPRGRVLLDRLTWRLAAHHVAVSAAVADRVSERDGIARDRFSVVPCGKDVGAWRPQGRRAEVRAAWGVPADASVVVWTGRLHPVKNVPLLVEALARLPRWWLLVVGDGEERAALASAVASLGVATRTVCTGEVDDVAPFLEAADVFCLCSHWEGSPGSLVEAMAAGLPAVATAVGGVPELITHGEDGLLVPPGDATALARAIREAAARPELGSRASETVRRRFSEAAMVDGYEAVWRAAASGRGPRRNRRAGLGATQ